MNYEIQGRFATLNEHDNANRRNRFVGAKMKHDMTDMVMWQLKGKEPVTEPCYVSFYWRISNKADYDNVRFACKYVLDGMVRAGILPNDNPKWVLGFNGDYFEKVPKGQEGVRVVVSNAMSAEATT